MALKFSMEINGYTSTQSIQFNFILTNTLGFLRLKEKCVSGQLKFKQKPTGISFSLETAQGCSAKNCSYKNKQAPPITRGTNAAGTSKLKYSKYPTGATGLGINLWRHSGSIFPFSLWHHPGNLTLKSAVVA